MASAGSGPRRSHGLLCRRKLLYNLGVPISLNPFKQLWLAFALLPLIAQGLPAQEPPLASGARILIMPRKIVSGEHATLAVLDVNGRLTPGAIVEFSNGDALKTDATGREMFVAPLNPQTIYTALLPPTARLPTTIVPPTDYPS